MPFDFGTPLASFRVMPSVLAAKQFGYAAVVVRRHCALAPAGRVLTRPSCYFAAKGGHIGRPQDICQ